MKNPWKRLSKINPQAEDGTRRINYRVFDALIKAKLPTAEMSVALTVISRTWGFNKKSDAISTSQFVTSTGFTSRAIKQARASLLEKRIIYFCASERVKRGSPINAYTFNKHYDTWIIQDRKRVKCASPGERKGKKRVNGSTPTIDNITIERNILAYISSDNPESILEFSKNFIEFIKIKKSNLSPKSKDLLKNSCVEVDKLIRLDGFSLKYIRSVLLWGVEDSFWEDNLFSLANLRDKKKGDPRTKFQKIANAYESDNKKSTHKLSHRSKENAKECIGFITEDL
jgi:phage replication O-like protein O